MSNCTQRFLFGLAGLAITTLAIAADTAPTPTANPADRPPPGTMAAAIRGYLDFYPPPDPPVPFWAFTWDPPASATLKRKPDDAVIRTIKSSKQSFSRTQVLNAFEVVDWHPEGHPPAPDVVMKGRSPQPVSCAFCHLPNGAGLAENAPLAGLPVEYFMRQVRDFRNKTRGTMDMRMASWHGMAEYITPPLTDAEARTAAEYYSRLKLKPYLKVVETATVPKVHSIQYTLVPVEGGGTEPIGNRIIETPTDLERHDLLDSEVGYTVYVPKGSIKKGEKLVKTGGGKTLPCTTCHGADLRGIGEIPPIAGRGPSNTARQLYNMKFGARAAPEMLLMKEVVKNLTDEDIVNIVAYTASLKP
jgi:cytochrome c553